MKKIMALAALALAGSVAYADVYSTDAVNRAKNVYHTKYYGAEQALNCAHFANVPPTHPSLTVVKGKDYVVTPHPAVKWAAEVDMQPRGHGVPATLCAYLQRPEVTQWYKQNFKL